MLHFEGLYGSDINPRSGYFGQDYPLASIVVSFVLFVGYTAVPALSVISGYLFFLGADRRTPPKFVAKWRKRLRSLLVPFLIWGGLFAVLGLVAARMGIGFLETRFQPGPGFWLNFLDAWTGYNTYPVAAQLWFVRDLILTVAVSPLIWIAVGWAPRITLAALCALWLGDHNLWIFTRLDVFGFFALGAAFAMHGWHREVPRRFALPLLLVFLALVFVRTVAPYFLGTTEGWGLYWMTCVMRVLGVVTAWGAAPLLMVGFVPAVVERYGYLAFFMHCAHFPPILIVKIVFGKLIDPQSSLEHLAIYALTIACTLAAVAVAAHLIRMISPALFATLAGGRTGPESGRRRAVTA
jgi:succinoglycan biosynthesis protein ExoH